MTSVSAMLAWLACTIIAGALGAGDSPCDGGLQLVAIMWPGPVARGPAASHMHRVPYHRYKVGQTVVAPSGGPGAYIPRGQHVIVRLLPISGQPQYRVRSMADGLERVVFEGQIIPAAADPPAQVWPPSPKPPGGRR